MLVGGVPCNNTTAGTWYARQRKTPEMKNLKNSFFNISAEVVIDICLSSHFHRFSCCVGLSNFTFCNIWHRLTYPSSFSHTLPETRVQQIANMQFRRPKIQKERQEIHYNVAQQSDNTVVETWYGRRQESKAKTLLGSHLKIEVRLDFFENRSPIRYSFSSCDLSARRLDMNLE